MVDDPIPIEGIIEGDPESLAVVCAAGGSAVIAYCAVVGADAYLAETVVAALADFRRDVVGNVDQEPSRLEALLVSATADAARRVAGVGPSPMQQTAAQTALEAAVTAPLPPGLAPRIIRALVEAAPVTVLGGDSAAVRREAEQRYIRMFTPQATVAAAAPAATAAPAPAAAAAPAAPPPPVAEGSWIPPELVGAEAAGARVPTPTVRWSMPVTQPTEAQPGAQPPVPPAPPPPKPGALVIKRGGHWPFRRTRKPSHGSPNGRGKNALVAGAVVLAVAAGIFAATSRPRASDQQGGILVRPIDIPFTVDGAVFDIARAQTSQWVVAIRRRAPRQGYTWLTLAAKTRNLSRPNFYPRALGYRLRARAGIVIGPTSADVPADIVAAKGRLPVGRRSSVHLAFQVPRTQDDLTLEFDPSPRAPRIRVPLN
jgi:hypothetical protein